MIVLVIALLDVAKVMRAVRHRAWTRRKGRREDCDGNRPMAGNGKLERTVGRPSMNLLTR